MKTRRVVAASVLLAIAAASTFALWPRSDGHSTPTSGTSTASRAPRDRQRPHGLAATRRVTGTVLLDETIAPGASVRLGDKTVKTDASGHFDLGEVVVGRYLIVAEVVNATGAMKPIDLRNPKQDADLTLVAHACDALLFGVVRDASGGPIAKARVFLADDSVAGRGPGVDAGNDGAYELCVDLGSNLVSIEADGYADRVDDITAFGKLRRDFELVPEAMVGGRAVRADDGAPVANASIVLNDVDKRVAQLSTTSGDDGRFQFRGVAPGSYELEANAPGLVTASPVPITAEVATPVEDVRCLLAGALSLAGHVIDKQKMPIGGTRVIVSDGKHPSLETITQADGSFLFDRLLPGEYDIDTEEYLLPAEARKLALDNSIADRVLEVEALGSIAGRVTRAGKPVEGAHVSARALHPTSPFHASESGTTDANGRFVLRGLVAGTYRMYAESNRVGAFATGTEVALETAAAKTGVELEMNLAGSIAGKVVDQTNRPVGGVDLHFAFDGRDFGEATTAEDGTFKVVALSGGGDYEYEITSARSREIAFHPLDGKDDFPPIAVADGNTHVTGVVIRIRYERLTISGRVVTSAGAGAPDVGVALVDRGGEGSTATTMTDTQGAFTIRDLPAGTYQLRAQAGSVAQLVTDIAAGAKNVEIRLPATGSIEGTLVGFSKPPTVVAYGGSANIALQAIVTGDHFVFAKAAIGAYKVIARSEDGYVPGEVAVTADHKATLVLENKGLGTLDGRVVDESHRPIARLYCTLGMQDTTVEPDGKFHFERVPAGPQSLDCFGEEHTASVAVTIVREHAVHVDVIAKPR